MLQKLCAQQRPTVGVKGQLEDIGAYHDPFARQARGTWHSPKRIRRHAGYGLRPNLRRHRRGRRGHRGCSSRACRRCACAALNRGWEKGGLVPVIDLPLIPQQHHGKAKNHPQDGAAYIVHEDFSGVDEGNSRENSPGLCSDTGSKPPSHQG